MRVGQRWRSVWRIEQASALKNVWLVLFFHQRWFVYLFHPLSMAPCESQVRARMGIWNSRHSDGYRYFVLLGRSQENGACAAGWPWLFASNIQPRGSSHVGSHRDGLRVHPGLLGTLGNEQRRGMDVAGGENEPALARHEFDRRAGANGEPHPHFAFHSVG